MAGPASSLITASRPFRRIVRNRLAKYGQNPHIVVIEPRTAPAGSLAFMNIAVPPNSEARPQALIDPFQRAITYLRVSVTDRCDFRCVYCMAEHMTFLPKADLLTLEELDRLCSAFIAKGVNKLRLTGGEPLVRRGIMTLVESLSRHLKSGALKELTLTTNGSQLDQIRRRAQGARRRAHQCVARHARRRQISRHYALGRSRPGDVTASMRPKPPV